MNRTKPTERIAGGQVPVEVRWHLHGDTTVHKTTFWCQHREEARQFLVWLHESPLQQTGFFTEDFVITSEMRIISIERLDGLLA